MRSVRLVLTSARRDSTFPLAGCASTSDDSLSLPPGSHA